MYNKKNILHFTSLLTISELQKHDVWKCIINILGYRQSLQRLPGIFLPAAHAFSDIHNPIDGPPKEADRPPWFAGCGRLYIGLSLCLARELSGVNGLSNYLFVFGLSACDIRNEQPHSVQMREFGDIPKTLTVSHLNFSNTFSGLKTGLKGLKRACKMATVASQLWPFQLLPVALSQARRARMRKSAGFFGGLKSPFHSNWRVLAEVFLSLFFAAIRYLTMADFADVQATPTLIFSPIAVPATIGFSFIFP